MDRLSSKQAPYAACVQQPQLNKLKTSYYTSLGMMLSLVQHMGSHVCLQLQCQASNSKAATTLTMPNLALSYR